MLHVSAKLNPFCFSCDRLGGSCDGHVTIEQDVDLDTWKTYFAPVVLACMAIQVLTSLCSEYLVSPMSWSWQAELEEIFLHKHIKTSGSTNKSCGEKLLCGGKTIGTATYNDARHNLLKNGAPLLINNMGDQRSAMNGLFAAVLLNLPTCS
jgi:hypothetical protein